ncbi:DNA-binding transcriptional regulator, PadR family [Marininema mesophilum]|uniref:DNA-binding transcriptional regulator, PadR family n=1 Tax=Marininema mesophilum TaxID=1048340 RepID=A0A1H2ZXT1_9BACL|nr:helix-turn-helix transcriptional regulator [Marininema mesophilum]SDX22196.1 DNA-binding transcriptional regulator, PadR family [Marininema mesophilum]
MSVEHIILGVLSWTPNSGYGIKSEVEQRGREQGWGRLSYGSIYPKLKKLEVEGLIQTLTVEEEGRKVKTYELTKEGWLELSNWLIQPPASAEIRDELKMKLSFWDSTLPGDRTTLIEHVELRRRETKDMLKHFDNWSHNGVSAIGEIGGMGMDYIKERLRLDLTWCDRMIAQLYQAPSSPRQDPQGLFIKSEERKKRSLED